MHNDEHTGGTTVQQRGQQSRAKKGCAAGGVNIVASYPALGNAGIDQRAGAPDCAGAGKHGAGPPPLKLADSGLVAEGGEHPEEAKRWMDRVHHAAVQQERVHSWGLKRRRGGSLS